jgi:two-component system heavy metal sensor histidine kinase CusS
MIADMLFLAKADNGLIVPHREEMDLGKEIDAVIEFYEPVTTEKGITIQRSGNAVFNGDALMMRRAFSNLISNAIRYTPEGQVVKVTLASGTDPIRIGFQNPGPHIPSQILERVFDRFYRIDSSRQRDTEGTGLGLAITKSIIEAHGGKIRALSTETTVCIEITL